MEPGSGREDNMEEKKKFQLNKLIIYVLLKLILFVSMLIRTKKLTNM